jgi:2-polyprenyl-6-methoxyphenol hydroxylase-like FAD-dependent oxidoreductase
MREMHVVVMGGGPVGLLCAIEAKNHFTNVTIIEKRGKYTRLNVPAVDPEIRRHFRTLGVHQQVGFGQTGMQGNAPFRDIEKGLYDLAISRGVEVMRPFVVTVVGHSGSKVAGRYKGILLTAQQWDDKNKVLAAGGNCCQLGANLLVVAAGGGVSSDKLVTEKLGFSYEKLKAKNYGAYGIFEKAPQEQTPVKFETRKRAQEVQEPLISRKTIVFPVGDYNYLLTNLSGITKTDFKRLQASQDSLKRLIAALRPGLWDGYVEKIKEVEKNVALFKIKIQRACQFFSPEYPAVVVGDAAVTPHPEQGSGYTTGFRGFEELKKLFEALEQTNRSNDDSVIYQDFNDRYELHVSRKALEGTRGILASNRKLLLNFAAEMKNLSLGVTDGMVNEAFVETIKNANAIADRLDREDQEAQQFLDYLKSDQGQDHPRLDWGATVGLLWERIAVTWKELKSITDRWDAVSGRLAELEKVLKVT